LLENADRSLPDAIRVLAAHGVEAAYLVPTETGLRKSILDAHAGVRSYFEDTKFHFYQAQGLGTGAKRLVLAHYLSSTGLIPARVSLYRPETKSGDPRLWPYDLNTHANPGNLLALFVVADVLYIANLSDAEILSRSGVPCTSLAQLFDRIRSEAQSTANELLERMRIVTGGQWIASMRGGPTGVGYTLETLLGISANNSKNPDYKGIEIKATRQSAGVTRNRSTLFSKTPKWQNSALGSGLDLLKKYGYSVAGRRQLYCSLGPKANSLGHYLSVRDTDSSLNSMHLRPDGVVDHVLHWNLAGLKEALTKKHNETFWVKAKVQRIGGQEQFLYSSIEHTSKPMTSNFVELIRLGKIELDYTLSEKTSVTGKISARDHGYLFKIWERDFNLLFPPSTRYDLLLSSHSKN
jgi:hypothetical protein